ncbi:MAG: FkbM family methyltransferase [Candidatus Micrarchaeota archaeon]|nr:FkbM family methyltransferase [Candidatus Micrarchaeota archaeon]
MIAPNNISAKDQFGAYASRLEDIRLFSKVIRNWHQVVLFRAGLRQSVTVMLRSGRRVELRSKSDYTKFFGSLEFQKELLAAQGIRANMSVKNGIATIGYKGKLLKFVHSPGLNELPSIVDQFAKEEYKSLSVKGRDVLDVGASIGDSSMYFALNGARHVYAFEPYPHPFSVARKNISANRLSAKITVINEGLGKPGFVRLAHEENTVGMPVTESKSGKRTRINSLKDIADRYDLKDAALKIDCEGCEYPIILDADENTLRRFSSIMIEYHYGYANLASKLKSAGFSVEQTKPRLMPGPNGWWMHMGMITARKD